jgi:hypothetical protein
LGSADAVRLAKEKLNAIEAELSAVEKNIVRTRSEFEARDRKLNDNIRAQQEAAREARAQHQTVEERKNPAYLSIGRHLAAKGVAPPNAPQLLAEAHRRREAVDAHLQHKAELALLSSQIDKQELRKFYFSVFSVSFCSHSYCLLFSNPPADVSGCRKKPIRSCRLTPNSLNARTLQNAGATKSRRFGQD